MLKFELEQTTNIQQTICCVRTLNPRKKLCKFTRTLDLETNIVQILFLPSKRLKKIV